MRSIFADVGRHSRKRRLGMPPRLLQLVNQAQKHVELADSAKPSGDSAKATAELADNVGIHLHDWQDLAKPARCHARPMQRAHVAILEALELPRKSLEPRAK
jgi:hypothetical protein